MMNTKITDYPAPMLDVSEVVVEAGFGASGLPDSNLEDPNVNDELPW